MKITEKQIQSLDACQTALDWRAACNAIKDASESGICYPDDWFEKVMDSGLATRVTSRWGATSDLKFTSHANLADALGELGIDPPPIRR